MAPIEAKRKSGSPSGPGVGARVATYAAGIEVGKAGVATVSPAEVIAMHEATFDQIGRLRRGGVL